MAMQTEATLFTAHVGTHTGVTTFLVLGGKDRSQEDVSLTPWCLALRSLVKPSNFGNVPPRT